MGCNSCKSVTGLWAMCCAAVQRNNLQLLIARYSDPLVRTFLVCNNASLIHIFIIEWFVQHLRLTRFKCHASIHGISEVNKQTSHMLSVHSKSRYYGWNITLYCAILHNITGTTIDTAMDTGIFQMTYHKWMKPLIISMILISRYMQIDIMFF
jgi:hypothetical protein